ncbi:hypothetical protein TRAPUB_10979 [Trametes pubescens]|uniref:Uncharacterized protein n=1 Tax=Trametes pubescens TaxID=154538 RepID=A0A1M2VXY4_TRAPU|nr:hypothetical protein TRAPUB_10979 [Trametes pubescens]
MPMDLDSLETHYTSSKATRTRRKKKREPKGGKPGNPGIFHGARRDYLHEHIKTFAELKHKARGSQNTFWEKLYAGYWSRWPWYIPLDKEPDEGSWAEPDTTNPEQLKAKGKVIKITQGQIRNHMRNERNNFMRAGENIWAPLLQCLYERANPPSALHMLSNWQLYMSKKPDEIDELFDERWPGAGLDDTYKLAFRSSMARELLQQESEEYQASLEAEAKDMHKAALVEYNRQMLPGALVAEQSEDTRQSAQDNLAAVVQPLLELIREYTGYYITLIAGIPTDDCEHEFKLKVLNAGKIELDRPRAWHEVDADRFKKEVMGSFTRFLMQTPEWTARMATQSAPPTTAPFSGLLSLLSLQASSSVLSPLSLPLVSVNSPSEPVASSSTAVGGRTKGRKGEGTASADAARAIGKGKGKGKATGTSSSKVSGRKLTSEDEAEFSDTGSADTVEDFRGDDSTEEEESCEDAQADAGLDMRGVPQEEDLLTVEELNMGDAIAEELARLSSEERRFHLHRYAQLSEFDRGLLRSRANAAALLNIIQPTPIPLWLFSPPARPPTRTKQAKSKAPVGPARKSSRLNPSHAAMNSTEPSEHAATSPSLLAGVGSSSTGATATQPVSSVTAAPTAIELSPASSAAGPSSTAATDPAVHAPPEPEKVSDVVESSSSATSLSAPQPSSSLPAAAAAVAASSSLPAAAAAVAASSSAPATAASSSSPAAATSPPPAVTAAAASQSAIPTLSTVPPGPANSARTAEAGMDLLPDVIMIDDDGWPDWLREAFDFMEGKQLGDDFTRALEWWSVVERTYDFETSAKGLPTEHRPPEVQHWLRVNRRVLKKPPVIKNEDTYCSAWWRWWSAMQPEWRVRDSHGRPVAGGHGDWEVLKKPGKNGFLIVLLTLVWWRECASVSTMADCSAAISDVSWVISAIAAAAVGVNPSKKRSSEQPSPRATKKLRI